MKKIVFFALLTLFASKLHAQESQTGYNFLRLPVSAHAAALGGDNVTLIEDDEALIFQNPALLSSVSDKTINLNYMNYMSGVNTASASFNRVLASSVLPTPVGPINRKLPSGLLGSLSPARFLLIASATALTASSCPMTRLCRTSSS